MTKVGSEGLEFYFEVDYKDSQILRVKSFEEDNAKPEIDFIYPKMSLPMADRRFKKGSDIDFEIEVRDEDDIVDVDWDLGDGTLDSETCPLSLDGCILTKQHPYGSTGTKVVYVVASESERSQEAYNATEVYIYDYGTIPFAIISNPKHLWVFEPTESLVDFNGNESYVAKCNSDCPAGVSCYDVEDLQCYDLLKSDIPSAYNLWFNWTISDGSGRFGNWSDGYDNAVEFTKDFNIPERHLAKLKLGYEEILGR